MNNNSTQAVDDLGIILTQPIEPPFQISEFTNSKTYNIYLNEEIIEADKYSKLFNLLRSVGEYDVVKIYINSPGGNLFTGVQLISCMKHSMAHIITILDGQAMSLAPLILFAGDEIQISENSMIMFHHYSSYGGGKGNEQLSSATAMNDFYRNTLLKYGKPFLEDDEIESVMNGQDLYFGDDEINRRIEKIMEDAELEEECGEPDKVCDDDCQRKEEDEPVAGNNMKQMELDFDNGEAETEELHPDEQ